MKKVLKAIILSVVFVSVLAIGTKVYANVTNNPIFPTIDEVRQMIAEALGQPAVLPPFTSEVEWSVVTGYYDDNQIQIDLNSKLGGKEIASVGDAWAVIHLPTGDQYAYGTVDYLELVFPPSDLPTHGTLINADIYVFYAGKSIHINRNITNWE